MYNNKQMLIELANEFRRRKIVVRQDLNTVHVSFPCDDWKIQLGKANWVICRNDKLLDKQNTLCFPGYTCIEDIASYINKLSIGIVNGEINGCDENLVRRTYNACRKKGLRAKYAFGYMFIENKFEAWCFEPKQGKIKLLHRNAHTFNYTRASSTLGDYHKQFEKVIEVEDIVNYIFNHTKKLYIPKNRSREAKALLAN